MKSRNFARSALFFLIGGFLVAVRVTAETRVFAEGRAMLPVFVEPGASTEVKEAAVELARVLGKLSGIKWPVIPHAADKSHGIWLGRSAPAADLKVAADFLRKGKNEVGPDGFRIRTVDGSIFIEAATPGAYEGAVAWLLQNEAGVRWVLPGDLGEIVPPRSHWEVPDLDETREPAYVSREIGGLFSAEEKVWAAHNGLAARLEYTHSLSEIGSRDFLASHPEWLPKLDGQHAAPTWRDARVWQPDLANPKVAWDAAVVADTAFQREPGRLSLSLGLNDTMAFDQGAATRELVLPLRFFRGMPDYSPLVFTFMNRTAELLTNSEKPHYLGCLAYFWCENAPKFRLNPKVVPYVASDRGQYFDRFYRDEDIALMSRWGASGVTAFGLWDYGFGAGFVVPRLPVGSLADAVREGWLRGARGYFADTGPQWGFDAPKLWVLAQLLWDPNHSPSKLEHDFYEACYGRAAAPMERFFERCEAIWMAQEGEPYWLKYYRQEDQSALFPVQTCRELRSLLDAAASAAADDPRCVERVALTSRAFSVTEAYVDYDGARRLLDEFAPPEKGSEGAWELAATDALARLIESRGKFEAASLRASGGPVAAMTGVDSAVFERDDPVPRLLWLAAKADRSMARRLVSSANTSDSEWNLLADLITRDATLRGTDLVENGSFAGPSEKAPEPGYLYGGYGCQPTGWKLKAMPTERGRVCVVDSPRRALRIEGAWDTQVYQWRAAVPEEAYVAMAQFRGRSSLGCDSSLFLTFLDKSSRVVGRWGMQVLPKGRAFSWRDQVLAAKAPPSAAWVGVGFGSSRQVRGDWLEVGGVMLMDDGKEAPL